MNDAQINCVVETILAAINYAAGLDLDGQPWLSRNNAGKFIVYPVSTKRPFRYLKHDLSPICCATCFPCMLPSIGSHVTKPYICLWTMQGDTAPPMMQPHGTLAFYEMYSMKCILWNNFKVEVV